MLTEEQKKKLGVTRWNILDYLQTEEDISGYLDAALEEGDVAYFLKALGDAAKARGINEMAKKMGVNRESLYKSFAENKKPYFETVSKALDALGLEFHISRKGSAKPKKKRTVPTKRRAASEARSARPTA